MLKRGIYKWDLVLMIINSIIGAGIFGLPSKIFALSGAYSLVAFVVCALAVMVIILIFAEVSSRFDRTGGPYIYIMDAFGPMPAYIMGWLLLIGRAFSYATLINLLVIYLSVLLPVMAEQGYKYLGIFAVTLFLTFINFIGIKNSTRFTNIFTVAKLVPIAIFIIAGLPSVDFSAIQFGAPPSSSNFATSVMLMVFAFGGFETPLINSGEINNPRKDLPFALIAAAFSVTIIYCLIQFICIGTLPGLASSEKPLADAASLFIGSWAAKLIAVGAFISIFGNLNGVMLSGSRLPYALSTEGQFPKLFSYVHPNYKTPTLALLVFSITVCLISFALSFIGALTIAVLIRLLVYLFVSASLIKLRKTKNDNFFRLPYGNLFGITGIIITALLLTSSGMRDVVNVLICAAVGMIPYLVHKYLTRKKITKP